jgi:hypothetical protein
VSWNSRFATERAGLRIGSRDFVDVISSVVELQVCHRAGGTADRLPIHAADEAEKRLGPGEHTNDVVALVFQSRAVDLDHPGVIGSAFEAQLAQPGRIKRFCRLGVAGKVAFSETPDGRVFGKVHDNASFIAYATSVQKKTPAGSAVSFRHAYLAGYFVEQGDPLVPKQLCGLALGLLPGRYCSFDQSFPSSR